MVAFVLVLVLFSTGATFYYHKNMRAVIEIPRSGGTHTEGVIGTPRFINPLLAVSRADQDIAAVVYAGLLTRDATGQLIPELAASYNISEDGTVYTFTLKDGLTFHDGTPLTAADVEFTIRRAASPGIHSPLFADWEGVGVDVRDERTIVFTLPEPYQPFLNNATIGILPKHLWADLSDDEFSFSQFNVEPIGAGPYKLRDTVVDASGIPNSYHLSAFEGYSLGTPHIDHLVFSLHRDNTELLQAFAEKQVDAIHAVSTTNLTQLLAQEDRHPLISLLRTPQLRVFGVFLNQNKQPVLLRDEVREALSIATPKHTIVGEVLGGYGNILKNPIPPGTLIGTSSARDAATEPTDLPSSNTINEAQTLLEVAGWERASGSDIYVYETDDQTLELSFSLATIDSPELVQAAELIADAWGAIGAQVDLKVYDATDLTQSIIRPRRYDALLFGLDIGHELDLYAFWHSSQRNDPGLNVAQFADIEADATLEQLRTERDATKRQQLLSTFVERVHDEQASIFIYSPDFTYVVQNNIHNVTLHPIADASERFDTIHTWYLETDHVWPIIDEWFE